MDMITNKQDYKYFLQMDEKALGINKNDFRKVCNKIWTFTKLLRKIEYYQNCVKFYKLNPHYYTLRFRFEKLSYVLGFEIPFNTCDAGLCLRHRGAIIINPAAKIGKNCRIYSCVNIGSEVNKAPIIGNDVYIGPRAKLIGDIEIADGIVIGAGAVVTKSFLTPNITIAGVPAIKISDNSSERYLKRMV